jgi:hypothetical protein
MSTRSRAQRSGQRASPERFEVPVQLAADPGHLRLGDPRRRPEGLDQVINLAGRHAMHVGLHDHRVERPIDPPAAFQQAREERPGPQLRDRQLDIPRRRRQHPGPVPVPPTGSRRWSARNRLFAVEAERVSTSVAMKSSTWERSTSPTSVTPFVLMYDVNFASPPRRTSRSCALTCSPPGDAWRTSAPGARKVLHWSSVLASCHGSKHLSFERCAGGLLRADPRKPWSRGIFRGRSSAG